MISILTTSSIVQESIFTEVVTEQLPSIVPQGVTSKELTLKEGTALHLEARVEPVNDASLVVEWFRNDAPLPTGHRHTALHSFGWAVLEVTELTEADTGTYSLLAKNSQGVSRMDWVVSLDRQQVTSRPPKFHYPFKSSLVVREGESVHVQTMISPSEDPSLKIEWFHNGAPLRPSNRLNTVSDFGHVLFELARAEAEIDSGEYVVVATNAGGVDSTRFTLHVQPTATIFRDAVHEQSMASIRRLEGGPKAQGPREEPGLPAMGPRFTRKLVEQEKIEVLEGQSVHLESQLLPLGDPSMTVSFLRNGAPLMAGERFRTLAEFGFVILGITSFYEEDSGLYEIVARNDFGEDTLRVFISCRGMINCWAHFFECFANRTHCFFSPTPARDRIVTSSALPVETIEGLGEIDRITSTGRQQPVPQEAVYDPPRFDRPLKDHTELQEGDCVHLETRLVSPVSDPNLSVEWFKDDRPLRAGNRLRTIAEFGIVILEISPVEAGDSGIYTVRATNHRYCLF